MSRFMRFLRFALIDVLVLCSFSLWYSKGKGMSDQYVCGFGPAVVDQRVMVDPLAFQEGRKVDVSITETLGGGCLNVLRAVKRLGVAVRPLVLVANDPTRAQVDVMLRAEFDDAMLLPMLTQTRRSILCGDACATVRPAMTQRTLTQAATDAIQQSDMVIIAPLSASDAALVARILRESGESILQLSESQVADAEAAAQLSRAATWTIINRRELTAWSGCQSLEAGLLVLQDLGVQDLIVTGSDGVAVLHRGKTEFQPSIPVQVTTSTVGAGDCFAGTFAATLIEGQPWREAIRLGQAAAALQLTGAFTSTGQQPFQEAVAALPEPLDLPEFPFRRRGQPWRVLQSVAAAVVGAGVLTAMVVGSRT